MISAHMAQFRRYFILLGLLFYTVFYPVSALAQGAVDLGQGVMIDLLPGWSKVKHKSGGWAFIHQRTRSLTYFTVDQSENPKDFFAAVELMEMQSGDRKRSLIEELSLGERSWTHSVIEPLNPTEESHKVHLFGHFRPDAVWTFTYIDKGEAAIYSEVKQIISRIRALSDRSTSNGRIRFEQEKVSLTSPEGWSPVVKVPNIFKVGYSSRRGDSAIMIGVLPRTIAMTFEGSVDQMMREMNLSKAQRARARSRGKTAGLETLTYAYDTEDGAQTIRQKVHFINAQRLILFVTGIFQSERSSLKEDMIDLEVMLKSLRIEDVPRVDLDQAYRLFMSAQRLRDEGKLLQAIKPAQECEEMLLTTLGPSTINLILPLAIQSNIYIKLGDFSKAIKKASAYYSMFKVLVNYDRMRV